MVTTEVPFPSLLGLMASTMAVAPGAYQELGPEGFAKAPVGTGPYKFVDFKPGDMVWIEESKPMSKLKHWTVVRGEQKKTA